MGATESKGPAGYDSKAQPYAQTPTNSSMVRRSSKINVMSSTDCIETIEREAWDIESESDIAEEANNTSCVPEPLPCLPDDPLCLLDVVRCGNLAKVQQMLQTEIGSINETNGAGSTPLILAAAGGYTSIAKALIEAGANTKTRNKSGQSAATWARQRQNHTLIQLLRDSGVEPDSADDQVEAANRKVREMEAKQKETQMAFEKKESEHKREMSEILKRLEKYEPPQHAHSEAHILPLESY